MSETPRTGPHRIAAASDDPESVARGQAAAAALLALSRAARSVVLYDAGNATVRHHLSEYQSKMCAALQAHGDMALSVGPFRLTVAGQVIYEDRDRERSLAFRLYRDGIRGIRILSHAPWDELLKLLQIIALRYTAIRQQEEDAVTLLRRAEFKAIRLEIAEGFTPAEESPEPEADVKIDRARRARPPPAWDTPLQKLPAPGPLAYQAVPDHALAEIREEKDEDAVAALSVSLARDLLAEATRGGWPMPNRDLVAFFAELRDGLLVDGNLAPLRQLVGVLTGAGASEMRDEMLRGLGDARTLEAVLASVPEHARELPPELAPFLPLLGAGPALERLTVPANEGRRRLLTTIVLARLPRETDLVLARLPTLEPALVRELAIGIVQRVPERSTEVARQLLAQKDDALRLEGLNVLENAPGAVPLRPLCDLLQDRSELVRIRAAEVLGRRGDESVIDALCASLDGSDVPSELSEAVGRALAQVAPMRAARLFVGWVDPKGRFLRGLTAQQRAQQWAAVAGTGLLPGNEPEATLRTLSDKSDGDLRRHCLATLARRRKRGDARG